MKSSLRLSRKKKKSAIFLAMISGYILASLTIFIWGITFICTKYLLLDFSALEILFYRFLMAYIALWAIHPKWEKIEIKDNLLFALAGLSGVVLYQYSENLAINFTTASNVSVIVSICPLFTAIIAQIFLKEKHIQPFFILGFILCIVGVALVSLNGSSSLTLSPKGDLLALFAAVCWGFYSLFVSILNKKNYDSLCATRRMFFFALLFMIPLMILGIKTHSVNFSASLVKVRISKPLNWICMSFLGVLASAFCFWAWNKACSLIGTVKATKGIYLIPLVTIVFAFFTLKEKISWMGALGAFLTIAGLFVSEIKFKQNKKIGK